ncbi:MmcQ/YjbR family DNA-binding protein [Vibrio quintilis]|nr:MmcQ/YjbR family DNA-binding protein [Vibrio quintilis]
MTRDEFNQFCSELPATTHVVQWRGADVWKIGGKVFAIGAQGPEGLPAVTFKTSDLNFEFLSDHEGFRPAPYFATRGMKWIQQTDGRAEQDEALRYYLQQSYRIVASGLSKSKQRALGLPEAPHLHDFHSQNDHPQK